MAFRATPTTPTTCSLRLAAGAGVELCPGSSCGLWDAGCVVERLDVPLRRDLASLLLDVRLELEEVRDAEAERLAHARFFQRLGPDLH